jgi:hypothetical protein
MLAMQTLSEQCRTGEAGRHRAVFSALVLGAFLIVAVLAALGVHFFLHKTLVVPFLFGVALAVRRFRLFVADWAVLLGAVVLFDSLRGLIYSLTLYFGWPIYSYYVIRAERAVLGGHLAPALLQAAFYDGHTGWLEKLTATVHASHFLVFLFFGMAVWVFRHGQFNLYARAMLIVMYAGLLGYLLLPTVPPWMASALGMIPALENPNKNMWAAVPALHQTFDTNPIAAMPSLHAAFPMLCCLLGWRAFGRKAWPLVVYTVLVAFSVMYAAHHYAVDVLAGWALAGVAYHASVHGSFFARLKELSPAPVRNTRNPAPLICLALFLAAEIVGHVKVSLDRTEASEAATQSQPR